MNTFHNHKRLWPVALAGFFALARLTVAAELKVGEPLPNLADCKFEGRLPENLAGKVILLDFWASWCAPCAQSFPVMEELHGTYASRGLVVIAVNVDDEASLKEGFLKKHKVSFPVVRDSEKKLVARVSPPTMPTSYLIDREGKVRFAHPGFHLKTTKKEYISEIESLLKQTP